MKVFIVTEHVEYEGDTVVKVFASYEKAKVYADELQAELDGDGITFVSVKINTYEVQE